MSSYAFVHRRRAARTAGPRNARALIGGFVAVDLVTWAYSLVVGAAALA